MIDGNSKYAPVAVDPEVLLAGIKFYRVDQPCILDHAMEDRAMITRKMHIDEFKTKCVGAAIVYIHSIEKIDTFPDGVYTFRFSMSDFQLSVQLIDEVSVDDRAYLDPTTFSPARPVKLMFLTERAGSLEHTWGHEELVKQIGDQLLSGIGRAILNSDKRVN